MVLLLLLTTTVLPDGNTADAKRTEIITGWKTRYAKIQTAEYRLEGNDIVTPAFFVGLPDPSAYLRVRRRPMELVWKLDFTERKAWVRKSLYLWQVELRRFERMERECFFDIAGNRAVVQTLYPDLEQEPQIRVHTMASAVETLYEMETLPLWFNSGVIVLVASAKPLELPNYKQLASGKRWTLVDNQQGAKDGHVDIELRCSDSRQRVLLTLAPDAESLPIRFRTMVRSQDVFDINIEYALRDGLPFADKWAATVFSSSGKKPTNRWYAYPMGKSANGALLSARQLRRRVQLLHGGPSRVVQG